MTVARALCMSLQGLRGTLVDVEAESSRGLPGFTIVGLPDSSTLQSRERVRGALAHVGHSVTDKKITVNLSPAWIPKSGSGFDLAIAMSTLASQGVVPVERVASILFFGELTLDGAVRSVPGVLPALLEAKRAGITRVCVADANLAEARLVPGIEVHGVAHVAQAVALCGGRTRDVSALELEAMSERPRLANATAPSEHVDFSDVRGQETARQAAEIAAAGGHHMLMVGPPGAGKTMIAARIPTILPPLEDHVALELSTIASLSGAFDARGGLLREAPFMAPHHTSTVAAIVGGGSGVALPGAISRAHGGVLFFDEAPEFSPRVLEALREPLESGDIVLHRSRGATSYPARFQLVLAANPCPCGRASGRGEGCQCSSLAKRRYMARLSGPIIDRIDLRITLPPVSLAASPGVRAESSAEIRERVIAARARQTERLAGTTYSLNAQVSARLLEEDMRLAEPDMRMLARSVELGQLTMRGRDRVRRVAWSIADLAGHPRPTKDDVALALSMRGQDT